MLIVEIAICLFIPVSFKFVKVNGVDNLWRKKLSILIINLITKLLIKLNKLILYDRSLLT